MDLMMLCHIRFLKYKIYISALTSLNIDEHNRFQTQMAGCYVEW